MSAQAIIEKEFGDQNPLDESLYRLDEEGLTFMKTQACFEDEEELKKHVLAVQAEAYKIHPYPCIRSFGFLLCKIARLPAYEQLLALGKERKDPIFLDIGCCFGNDIRRAIQDGFPQGGAIGSDLYSEFWDMGHKLFRSTPKTFPVPFVPGDAFDPAFLEPTTPAPPSDPRPGLSTLTSLNPLRGHVSAIHASSFFHLFDEEKQLELAKALAGLLSPEPGSIILGAHGGGPEKGLRVETFGPNSHEIKMFCHSPESWKEMWDGQVFEKGTVKVEADLIEVKRTDLVDVPEETKFYIQLWSVTRL
ncbi:hypothetical protein GSI_07083 [Ganoderma sinense ZZ0214-1]|uniref:Methyltransferase domain-containing protein n=1 Tax=Ganoderma sinense ZZ0214-1 TaxID=1077348 RepID=A0A2G8SAX2_9APHY|nr:hypothetical protein GSI_07083 [Ganoderma sinense ZZ0214-1]